MVLSLAIEKAYPTAPAIECWRGYRIVDDAEFANYLRERVRVRLDDSEFEEQLQDDLTALAVTDLATETLAQVLGMKPAPLDWQIGEALAECLLEDEFGVTWPWNEIATSRLRARAYPVLISWDLQEPAQMCDCCSGK